MQKAILILGGNLGDILENFKIAENLIEKYIGPIEKKSLIYNSEAWPNPQDPEFSNEAILIHTHFKPWDLLLQILVIERKMGRYRSTKNAARIIDIDLLMYNDEIIFLPLLQIPHPLMHTRKFVLNPLKDIAGNDIHPIIQKSFSEILNNLNT